MESVEEMCESIALINKGEIILQGKVTEIQHQFKHHEFSVSYDASTPFSDSLVEKYKIRFSSNSSAIIKLEEDMKPSLFLREALNAGVEIFGLSEILPSIHDIFIEQVQNHRHA
jgi:ABC-2 type transport system ATP-binding protein